MAKAFPGGENQFQMYAKYYGKLACRFYIVEGGGWDSGDGGEGVEG